MSTTTNLGLFKHDNPATNTDEFNVDKALNQNWDKLDTAIGKDRERLTKLENDNTTNKKDITDIKAKNTEQDKYIAELEAENTRLREDLNGLPKGQASGESIDISDSAEMRCELKISGNSKQDGEATPDTPVEVECCGDNINLFDKEPTLGKYYYNSAGVKTSTTVWELYEFAPKQNTDYTLKTINKYSNNVYIVGIDSEEKVSLITNFSSNKITFNSSNYAKIRYSVHTNDLDSCKLEQGSTATPYSPYGQGCISEVICNKNLAKINTDNFELTSNTIKNKSTTVGGNILTHIKLKAGQTITSNLLLLSKPSKDTSFSVNMSSGDVANLSFSKFDEFNLNTKHSKTYTATEDIEFDVKIWGNANKDIFEFQYWIELDNTTEYVQHKSQTYTIPTQQPMRSVRDIRDTFIKKDGKRYEHHPIVRIESYNGETITSEYMSNTGELSTGAIVDYISENPTDIECTEEQNTILDQIEKEVKTYKNITHIYSTDNVSPNVEITYKKDIETMITNIEQAILSQGGNI